MDVIRIQFYVLVAGTAFAWFNVAKEIVSFSKGKDCKGACPVGTKRNVFLTPCFWGAIFFTIALLLNPTTLSFR